MGSRSPDTVNPPAARSLASVLFESACASERVTSVSVASGSVSTRSAVGVLVNVAENAVPLRSATRPSEMTSPASSIVSRFATTPAMRVRSEKTEDTVPTPTLVV